jgi:hypothetical protein
MKLDVGVPTTRGSSYRLLRIGCLSVDYLKTRWLESRRRHVGYVCACVYACVCMYKPTTLIRKRECYRYTVALYRTKSGYRVGT